MGWFCVVEVSNSISARLVTGFCIILRGRASAEVSA